MAVSVWSALGDAERSDIIRFVEMNLERVKRDIVEKDPNLYAGNRVSEVAPGWVIIRGVDYIRIFIEKG